MKFGFGFKKEKEKPKKQKAELNEEANVDVERDALLEAALQATGSGGVAMREPAVYPEAGEKIPPQQTEFFAAEQEQALPEQAEIVAPQQPEPLLPAESEQVLAKESEDMISAEKGQMGILLLPDTHDVVEFWTLYRRIEESGLKSHVGLFKKISNKWAEQLFPE